MKIVHIVTGLGGGGAETLLLSLVSEMKAQQHVVVSLSDKVELLDIFSQLEGVTVVSLSITGPFSALRGLYKLISLLKKEKPQLLHSWMYHSSIVAALIAPFMKCGHICALHASQLDLKRCGRSTALAFNVLRLLSKYIEPVVCNSESTFRFHRKSGYSVKRLIVPNGIDTDRFKPNAKARIELRKLLDLDESVRLVGLLGRWDPMKNHEGFLRSARMIAEINSDVHFVLAGAGISHNNRFLKNMVAQNGLEEKVHLLGFQGKVENIIQGLDVSCCLSVYGESFSNIVAESMSCGIPVVVSELEALVTLVSPLGWVVNVNENEVVAKTITTVLEMERSELSSYKSAARDRIVKSYSKQQFLDSYQELYSSVASSD